ncbi:hypothetical protein JET14_03470 [Martelella lutilitoris]|uniref:Uncharacterized protein n=1 Tax=Martelella lutilitoris TaxID=2583532 RepID=A0A7T7HLC8_9HYPH|nr:hypothetical protein [Martelella lutilitoris]QQM31252.1 hypothetical protein JET14_03470 [Martelella lutilitoris]
MDGAGDRAVLAGDAVNHEFLGDLFSADDSSGRGNEILEQWKKLRERRLKTHACNIKQTSSKSRIQIGVLNKIALRHMSFDSKSKNN